MSSSYIQRTRMEEERRRRRRRRLSRRTTPDKLTLPSLDNYSDEERPPTDKEIAGKWKMPPSCADRAVEAMMIGLSYFYDFSAAIISIVDVTTDALVTYEFWRDDKTFFFVFSLCIMLVAHLAFAFLFIALYCGHTWTDKQRVLLWFSMVPLAQAVPLFIWIHSFEFQWFLDLLAYFGLNTDQPGSGNINDNDDPLMKWIQKKFSSHGGFIMEACVEAFPQSILQMISIVIYHEHTTLNLVSVIISMSAVASKSVMLAYNIDRRVFLFNFACFVGDIFNVFATVAWVFHAHEPGNFVDDTFSWVWVYKIGGLAFFIAGFGILHIRRWVYEVHGRCCQPWNRLWQGIKYFCNGVWKCCTQRGWGQHGFWCRADTSYPRHKIRLQWYCNCGYQLHQHPCWKYSWKRLCHNWFDWVLLVLEFLIVWPLAVVLFLIMGTGLYIFAIMAGEIFKLGFMWLMILGAGQQHRISPPFYRYLFSFLQTSRNNKDCKLRLALTNQKMLERHFQEVPREDIRDPDQLERRHRMEKFCKRDPTDVSFMEMHGFNSGNDMTCSECIHTLLIEGCQKNFWRWAKCECFDTLEHCYFITLLVPYDVLSALLTIFFPIIAMCITPQSQWTVLQTALTSIYIFTLVIVLLLSVYVYKFFRLSSSVFAPMSSSTKTIGVVDGIIAFWKDFISTEIRNQIVAEFFPDIYPIITEMGGTHRVHNTEWVPPLNWRSAGHMEVCYTDFIRAPRKCSKDANDVKEVELVLGPQSKDLYNEGGLEQFDNADVCKVEVVAHDEDDAKSGSDNKPVSPSPPESFAASPTVDNEDDDDAKSPGGSDYKPVSPRDLDDEDDAKSASEYKPVSLRDFDEDEQKEPEIGEVDLLNNSSMPHHVVAFLDQRLEAYCEAGMLDFDGLVQFIQSLAGAIPTEAAAQAQNILSNRWNYTEARARTDERFPKSVVMDHMATAWELDSEEVLRLCVQMGLELDHEVMI